ncbi:MAG: hypothetical protein K2O61_10005 [Bacteroidaceae bacterium]|nr:hypothetical protein [Bacteroidaceae bacterium]
MSVAFVAVESVKSYTSIACDRLLGLNNFVEDAMNECRKMLVDKETISHIQPVVVDGRSTNTVIEESKRDLESLEKEIGRVEEERKNEIIDVCQVQSLSSLCFFIFLFNIVLLFAGGLDSLFPNYIHSFVVVLCVCSIFYFL